MKKIYFFDFDGTITFRDSFLVFTFFSINFLQLIKYWFLFLFYFFIIPKSRFKEFFFNNFSGMELQKFNEICNWFISKRMNNIVRKSFYLFLKSIDKNSKVVVVSASISNYLKPWCNEMGFDLICTELEVIDGKLTGRFSTPNCNGKEKVKRINEKHDLSSYDEIHVFGNSKGDFPMLELGTHKYYKFFK